MSLSRRRSARRTSGKTVSLNMRRLLLMRLLLFVEPLWWRTVIYRDLKYVELSMSQSVGLSKRFMTLRMMLLSARLRLRRSVKMKRQATPPTPSAPSGPRKCVLYPRSQSRSSLQSQVVPRSQGSYVLLLVVGSRKELRSVLTRSKQLFRMPLRNSVLLSPSVPASMRPNLYPSLLLPRNVWMYPRRSVHAQEPTQGKSRSQLSRNGATYHLRSLDLPKIEEYCVKNRVLFLTEILQDLSPEPATCSKPKRNNSDLVKNCLPCLNSEDMSKQSQFFLHK